MIEQSTRLSTEPASWLTEELLTKLDGELQRLGEPLYGVAIDLSRELEAQHYRETTPPWLRPAPG